MGVGGYWFSMNPCVEQLEVGSCDLTGADVVEDADEHGVGLAIDGAQLDADQLHLAEHLGVEEERAGVEGAQQLAVFLSDHGFQLIDVAHEQQLFAAEGLSHVSAIDAQHLVDEVDDVGPDH